MKTNLVIMALASLAISACASAPTPEATTAPSSPQQETAASSAAAETGTVSTTEVSSSNLAAQLEEMQKNSVYFDFGEFVIKPEFRDLILQRADFMKAHGDIIVTLEGNADERGSSEFNLALGDKRANAVRKSLEMLGVPESQTKTVSMGEEHPRLTCHEEQCWKENRRVDFVVKPGS